jgi:hypothetical protein
MRGSKTRMGAYMPSAANTSKPRGTGTRGRRACRGARRLALAASLALPLVFVLDAVAKDTTRPIVKFELKQGQHFNTVTTATMSSGEPLTIRAVVRDPQGVKSLTVSFPHATADTCTSGGTIFSGSFPITLPAKKSVSVTGVHTKLVTNVTIPYPLCHEQVAGHTVTGASVGHTFKVVLVGHNRSSNPSTNHAKTTLIVTLQ